MKKCFALLMVLCSVIAATAPAFAANKPLLEMEVQSIQYDGMLINLEVFYSLTSDKYMLVRDLNEPRQNNESSEERKPRSVINTLTAFSGKREVEVVTYWKRVMQDGVLVTNMFAVLPPDAKREDLTVQMRAELQKNGSGHAQEKMKKTYEVPVPIAAEVKSFETDFVMDDMWSMRIKSIYFSNSEEGFVVFIEHDGNDISLQGGLFAEGVNFPIGDSYAIPVSSHTKGYVWSCIVFDPVESMPDVFEMDLAGEDWNADHNIYNSEASIEIDFSQERIKLISSRKINH